MSMLTYQTNVWEGDYRVILNGSYLEKIISRCDSDFVSKEIIVNNVDNREEVENLLKKKIVSRTIDRYYFVEDYIKIVLDHFKLTKEDFKGAYYVSSSELVGIYLCKSEYLLYFKGDSHLYKGSSGWIHQGLKLLSTNREFLVANPTWNNRKKEAQQEADAEIDNFYISYGFSDQCFLTKVKDLQRPIYNTIHPDAERYPWGNSFEAMLYSHMKYNGLRRLTHKYDNYRHKNFRAANWVQNNLMSRGLYSYYRLNF